MINKYGRLDKRKFAQTAYDHANTSSTGYCARYVQEAMARAGLHVPLRDAWLYSREKSKVLKEAGFAQVSPTGYQPQVGDLVIWMPCLGNPALPAHAGAKHKHGHIQVYTGRADYQWVSDFRQHHHSRGSVPGLPGDGWDNKRAVYEIYRYLE